jgi:membrane-associated phospholipid phosphatase
VVLNHRRALFVALGLLCGAGLMCLLVAVPLTLSWLTAVDQAAWRWSDAVQNPPATLLAQALSLAGGVWVNWPLRILAALLLAIRRRFLQLAAFALAVVSSEALIGVLKSAYQRARPPGSLIETSGFSFPSGHAVAGAVTAVGLVVVLLPPGRLRWRWEVYAVIFTFVMALSRVYLRAHWLSDTVAGGLLGAGLALGWPAVLQALRGRPDPAQPGPAAVPDRS